MVGLTDEGLSTYLDAITWICLGLAALTGAFLSFRYVFLT